MKAGRRAGRREGRREGKEEGGKEGRKRRGREMTAVLWDVHVHTIENRSMYCFEHHIMPSLVWGVS